MEITKLQTEEIEGCADPYVSLGSVRCPNCGFEYKVFVAAGSAGGRRQLSDFPLEKRTLMRAVLRAHSTGHRRQIEADSELAKETEALPNWTSDAS